jgi:hypothetical protein
MSERRSARRQLAAALTGATLLLLGAPLHRHAGANSASAPTLSAEMPLAGNLHAGADCPACQSNGRTRAGLAPAALAAPQAPVRTALRLSASGAPAAPSGESRPPTPPRGPPSPTA